MASLAEKLQPTNEAREKHAAIVHEAATTTTTTTMCEKTSALEWQQQLGAYDKTVDVTELCRQVAATLRPDEMIHDAEFSLYSAMSALELMDAKMDKAPPALEPLESRIKCGTLPINFDAAPHSTVNTSADTSSLKSSQDVAQNTSAPDATDDTRLHHDALSERALDVLDGMSVCELAWHEGGSMPETLYACLYLHPIAFSAMLRELGWEPPALGSEGVGKRTLDLGIKEGTFSWKPVGKALTLAVLAQTLATLRCCAMVREVIILADIFEEEDFYPSTFGFRLSPPVEDDSLMDLLELAMVAMADRIRAAGAEDNNGNDSADKCILAHLAARKEFLLACMALRDAFTNKQRQRRLHNLARQRAAKAEQQERENPPAPAPAPAVAIAGCSESIASSNNPKPTIGAAADGLKADDSAVQSTDFAGCTTELNDSERRVAAAAAGLAKLTLCDSLGQKANRDRGLAEGADPCEFVREVVGDTDGAVVAGEPRVLDKMETVEEKEEEEEEKGVTFTGVRATPTAPPAENALSYYPPVSGQERGNAAEGVDLTIEGNHVADAAEMTLPPQPPPDEGHVQACMDVDDEDEVRKDGKKEAGGHGVGQAGQEVEGDEEEVKDVESPLQGIERCERHLCAAVRAFDSLLEALSAGGDSDPHGSTKASSKQNEATAEKLTTFVGGDARANDESSSSDAERSRRPAEGEAGQRTTKGSDATREGAAIARVDAEGTAGGATTEETATPMPPAETLGGRNGGFAFEPEMNRHLLGSSPHHHVHFRWGKADGVRVLRVLAKEAARACGVIRCRDLADVRRYLLRFSQPPLEGSEPAPGGSMVGTAGLFARSVAAVCLYRQSKVLGQYDMMEFVADAMINMGVPDAVVNCQAGNAFLARVGKPVYETLRVLCLNRARQRSSLEAQMQDWRLLQEYADTVDEAFLQQYNLADTTPRYMAKWAVCEALGLMHRYIQIGIELQLPAQHELQGTYWYWDFVMTTKLVTEGSLWEAKMQLAAIKAQMEEERRAEEESLARAALEAELDAERQKAAEAAATASAAKGKKASRKKKKSGKKKAGDGGGAGGGGGGGWRAGPAAGSGEADMASLKQGEEVADEPASPVLPMKTDREISWEARREWETADMKLRQCLCRGTVRLLAGLESLQMMAKDAECFRFTSGAIVHRQRYRAFQALDLPAFQEYEEFLAAVAFPPQDASAVIASAGECFRTARSLAVDLLRRGDQLAADSEAAAADAADAVSGGRSGLRDEEEPRDARATRNFDGNVEIAGIGTTAEAWKAERAELVALAKVSVSNAVVSSQVAKRASGRTAGAGVNGRGGQGKDGGVGEQGEEGRGGEVRGRVRVEFGVHSQFPVVTASLD